MDKKTIIFVISVVLVAAAVILIGEIKTQMDNNCVVSPGHSCSYPFPDAGPNLPLISPNDVQTDTFGIEAIGTTHTLCVGDLDHCIVIPTSTVPTTATTTPSCPASPFVGENILVELWPDLPYQWTSASIVKVSAAGNVFWSLNDGSDFGENGNWTELPTQSGCSISNP